MTVARNERGHFLKGASGNPGGRPKSAARYRRLFCQQLTDKQFVGLVDKLLELANGGDVKAIRLCLEYCIGRPAQSELDTEGQDGAAGLDVARLVAVLSDDEVSMLLARLEQSELEASYE